MKIVKKELQDALEKVKPGLANKELISQTTSFAFIKGTVVTYDDNISISHPVKDLNLSGAIQAEGLYKFLSKIKNEYIDIEVTGSEVSLTSGRFKSGFTLQAEIVLPLNQDIKERSAWKDLPKYFVEGCSFAMAACSKDNTVLKNINVQHDGLILASDNNRVSQYDLQEEVPCATFLLPATSVAEMVKLNPVRIAEGKGWVHFETEEGTIISCRTVKDHFPKVSHLLPLNGPRLLLPNAIDEILDRAMVVAKQDHISDEMVEILVENRLFTIRSASDTAWFEESANVKYEDKPLHFKIVPYLLKYIISKTGACTVGENKLKFEGERWQYVTALISE